MVNTEVLYLVTQILGNFFLLQFVGIAANKQNNVGTSKAPRVLLLQRKTLFVFIHDVVVPLEVKTGSFPGSFFPLMPRFELAKGVLVIRYHR